MTITEWAENEIELIKKEYNSDRMNEDIDLALKAYKLLVKDSTRFSKVLLDKLMQKLPLTSITEDDNNWDKDRSVYLDGITVTPCNRCSFLFKKVTKDGTVTYYDTERTICCDAFSKYIIPPGIVGTFFYNKARQYVDEAFPITLPYYPGEKCKVMMDIFLHNPANTNTIYDTTGFHYIEYHGKKHDIGKYFHNDVEISKKEFDGLKAKYIKRMKESDNHE